MTRYSLVHNHTGEIVRELDRLPYSQPRSRRRFKRPSRRTYKQRGTAPSTRQAMRTLVVMSGVGLVTVILMGVESI